jgi:ArsR family transcriptional regulator
MLRKPLTDEALDLVAQRFKALSEPLRLKLIMALMDGPKNVGELVEEVGATQANVSRHLQNLGEAGILKREKKGLHVFYAISDPSVFQLCDLVCGSIEEFLKTQVNAFKS